MKFADQIMLTVQSGKGGNGCSSFRRERFIPKGGPDGGHGGKGGDIIFVSNSNLTSLNHLIRKRKIIANAGGNGEGAKRAGRAGKNLIIQLPIGTQLYIAQSKVLLFDFTKDKQTFLAVIGGKGGVGNSVFKSSTNQAPTFASKGEEGEELILDIKLKLISDIAIIGMPNVGKSTLINHITFSKTKSASYPFSTVHPVVSSVYYEAKEYKITDIPGLTEGAACGKGLGDKSLPHLEKTKVLIHLIDACQVDVLSDFQKIRTEIQKYSKEIANKPYIVVLSRTDLIDLEDLKKKQYILEEYLKREIFLISKFHMESLHKLIAHSIKYIE